jgi:hypothetical protein
MPEFRQPATVHQIGGTGSQPCRLDQAPPTLPVRTSRCCEQAIVSDSVVSTMARITINATSVAPTSRLPPQDCGPHSAGLVPQTCIFGTHSATRALMGKAKRGDTEDEITGLDTDATRRVTRRTTQRYCLDSTEPV